MVPALARGTCKKPLSAAPRTLERRQSVRKIGPRQPRQPRRLDTAHCTRANWHHSLRDDI